MRTNLADSPRRSRPRRLWRIALVLIGAQLAYLIAGNAFLNTALADAAFNRKPERFQLHWERAYTLWPGHVSARGVSARGQARRVQWQAQATRADARIALWPLLRRELRIDPIDAEQLQFDAERVETDLPPPEARDGAWVIHLPRLRSDSVQRARWEAIEAVGTGSVEFGLWKQLRGGALEILPSRLQLQDASISQAQQPWLQQVRLSVVFALARHLNAEAPGIEKLKLATLAIRLDADAPHVSGALGSDDWLRLDVQPGGGRLAADLALKDAQMQPGGTLRLALPLRYTDANGTQRDNTLTLDASVDQAVVLRADLPEQADGIGSLAADLRLSTRAWPAGGVHALLPHLDGDVSLDWRFESLRWLSGALVRGDWLSFDGAGELQAQLKIVAGQLATGSRIEVPEVDVSTRVLQDHIRGVARARGELVATDNGPEANLQIELQRFAIAAETSPQQVYVRGTDLTLDLSAAGELARLRDTLRGKLRFSNAEVPDLTVYNQYLPQRNLAFTGGRGRVGADLDLDAAGLVGKGRVRLNAKGAALRVSELALRGDVAVDARLRRVDIEGRRFDLGGSTVALDRVGYAHGDERADGWWARVALPRSETHWGRPLQLDGEADVRMKDVGFLLALFAQKRSFPKWAMRLIDAGEAAVSGKARLRGDVLILDHLHAANERFRARARLRLHDTQRRGDLLLGWKKLDVGLELRDAERKWHLRRAEQWFEQGKPFLPAASR